MCACKVKEKMVRAGKIPKGAKALVSTDKLMQHAQKIPDLAQRAADVYDAGKKAHAGVQEARKTFRKAYNSKKVQGLGKYLDKAERIKSHGIGKFVKKARRAARKVIRKI